MLTKTIDLTDKFCLNENETRISPMIFSSGHGFEVDDRLTKTAASETALEFASKLKPIPGARIILVSAMGSSDAWGANKKGDTFPEAALLGRNPDDVKMDLFSALAHRLPKEWGITLFPTKRDETGRQIGGGNTFHEHVNRPARMADGLFGPDGSDVRCGDILASFWNPLMRRVELIQTVWERKLPHIVRMIDEGFLPGISMACDVPFDRCSVCGNLAQNDFGYCKHLSRGAGLRGKLWNNQKIIMMINDFPMLFDSSIVATPAAVEGRALKKIAHMGRNPVQEEKQANLQKQASYEKLTKIASVVERRENEKLFSFQQLDKFREVGILKSACVLADMGISFNGAELGYMLFPKSASAEENGRVADAMLPQVLHQRFALDLAPETKLALMGSLVQKSGSALMGTLDPSDAHSVIRVAAPMVPARSVVAHAGTIIGNPRSLSVGRMIDLNQPLRGLNEETKAVLLTRILSDVEIVKHLQNMLVKPLVMWELSKVNMGHLMDDVRGSEVAPEREAVMPMLGDMTKDYAGLDAGRAQFYQSRPGSL